jgi:hypothetical protein
MAATTSRATIEEIQRRMAQIRLELHEDVRSAVTSARSMTDWRVLVASHPWLYAAAAAAIGYLVVPKRAREARNSSLSAAPTGQVQAGAVASDRVPEPQRGYGPVLSTAFSLVAPLLVRLGQNYFLNSVERWLAQYPLFGTEEKPAPAPSGNSARWPNGAHSSMPR